MSLRLGRLRGGECLALCGALALLVVMFALRWFSVRVPGVLGAFVAVAHLDTSQSAWDALEGIRWLLLATALAALALAALRVLEPPPPAGERPVRSPAEAAGAAAMALGACSAALVLVRASIDGPYAHTVVRAGAWLGLIACLAIAWGGYLALRGARALESAP